MTTPQLTPEQLERLKTLYDPKRFLPWVTKDLCEIRTALPLLIAEVERLRERIATMDEALKFYAEKKHFTRVERFDWVGYRDELVDDGEIARRAREG